MQILKHSCISFAKAELMHAMGFIQNCSFAAHIRNSCNKENTFKLKPVFYPGGSEEGYEYPKSNNCLEGVSAYNLHELFTMVGTGTNAESLLANMIGLKTGTSKFTLVQVMCNPDFIAQCLIDIHATSQLDIKEANARLKKYADEK